MKRKRWLVKAEMCVKLGCMMLVCGLFVPVAAAEAELEERVSVTAFPNLMFSSENIVTLPPAEITGTVLRSDQRTPYNDIEIALLDPETGEVAFTTVTGEDGGFVFEDVQDGRYVVRIGNPGIVSILDVDEAAEPGTLDVAVPATTMLPVPGWAPGWVQNYPALGYAIAGGAVVGGVAYWRHRRERDRELSPIMP